jgi:hypothetical protein
MVIGAERGWIARSLAAERVLAALRILDNPLAFGPQRVGRIGHRGFCYHFWGTDGRRRLNYDQPDTAEVDESLNTVELSSVDTALAVVGVLVAQSYFSGAGAVEAEIRSRAQSVYDRVDWPFLYHAPRRQFFHGWKPNEFRNGPSYAIRDADGRGAYSGIPGGPLTWDMYTDEVLIIALAAIGSPTHRVPADAMCAFERRFRDGLVVSYPGSLFTFQFLRAFLDTETLGFPACPGEPPINWYENSRRAIQAAIAYASENPNDLPTYGPDAWGISAAEGPSDQYHGYGMAAIAVDPAPEEDGTVTHYAALSAAAFGADLRARAISALRAAWTRGHWHPRFGLPDAFNDDISRGVEWPESDAFVWRKGPWLNRALFAIDLGPMLLSLENARSGLIWNLLAGNDNIQRALSRIRSGDESCPAPHPEPLMVEGEWGTPNLRIMPRGAASGSQTVWLLTGETQHLTAQSSGCGSFMITVRYSNSGAPGEIIRLALDGQPLSPPCVAQNTSDWNVFAECTIGPFPISIGVHDLSLSVSGGDGFGWELDRVTLTRVSASMTRR